MHASYPTVEHTGTAAEYIWFNSLDKLLRLALDKKLLQFCSTIQLFINELFHQMFLQRNQIKDDLIKIRDISE